MKKFTGLRLQNLAGNTGLVKLGLVILAGLIINVGRAAPPANDNFANASPLIVNNYWGTTNGNNALATSESSEPSHAGYAASHSVWYQWVAPQDGVVQFDTLGTSSSNDTVLAVYTGNSLATLNQVAANDDLYPYWQWNYTAQNIYHLGAPHAGVPGPYNITNFYDTTNLPILVTPVGGDFYQPYGGPSGLHFTAVYGTTYYIAVDSKSLYHYTGLGENFVPTVPGPFTLNWAYQPSGVFRMATENIDQTGLQDTNGNPMLLYQCSENETARLWIGTVLTDPFNTTMHTYYDYNVPGVLVTVTRVGGSSGRVSVHYTTKDGLDGNVSPLANGDIAALAGSDYIPISGTLTFNDFEMSKTLKIQIPATGNFGVPQPNRVFTVVLSNPQLDTNESPVFVSPPRVDSTYYHALVRILDVDTDPKGPAQHQIVVTNGFTTIPPIVPILQTNIVYTPNPTNAVFNFMKAHFQVPRDVTNFWKATPITVYVIRTGTNAAPATVYWRVGSYFLDDVETLQDIYHPAQPGSDYATPDPTNYAEVNGLVPDYNFNASAAAGDYTGTLTFPGGTKWDPQPIQFTIYDNGLTRFNEDFHIELYEEKDGHAIQAGMVAETTVTILNSTRYPPAGSVDEHYNADYSLEMAPPFGTEMAHPGTDKNGEVYDLAILPNNETVIVGDFAFYDTAIRNGIALINTDGSLDTSFYPGSGMGGGFHSTSPFIKAVALAASNKYIIGGNFTTFGGATTRNGIARVNASGSLDTTFLNNLAGADGVVRAVAVQPDGKVVMGGDFTHINGTPCNYIARLNTDGSRDTNFNLGAIFTSSVYTLALQPNGQILVGGNFLVNGQNYAGIARLNADGSLDTSFDSGYGTDGTVLSVVVQPDGTVLIGGNFTDVNGSSLNGIARLKTDGSIDPNFFPGTGADDTVRSIIYSTNVTTTVSVIITNNLPVTNTTVSSYNVIYVGGSFTSYNGTRRVGFARLYNDGTLDTSFLDTAYNQFAGLVRIYSTNTPTVFTCGVQSDGNVMIGGSFSQVGGGEFSTLVGSNSVPPNYDSNVWPERNDRAGIRNRANIARLIGGATTGPGNIGLQPGGYSSPRSGQVLYVNLVRTNGTLGSLSANFSVQPELAQSGADYVYDASAPLYWIAWEYVATKSRMHSDGLFGPNGLVRDVFGNTWAGGVAELSQVLVDLPSDTSVAGDLTANFQLANPSLADQFYLGGENIPLGGALGPSVSPFTLVDDAKTPGVFGFASSTFIATSSRAVITVLRSNGVSGAVSMSYSTSNGTAVANTDYTPINPNPKTLNFDPGIVSQQFNITILDPGYIYTNFLEKTVNLSLCCLGITPGASFGISNAVLRLINPNFKGYLTFSATNFNGTQSSGFISFIVNRVSGSSGALSVQYATTNGPPPNGATNNVDYNSMAGTLSWISGDVSPRIVKVPLTPILSVGPNKIFAVSLFNPLWNGSSYPGLFYGASSPGSITNATLTIINDNSYGTLQFSAPSYLVNENGGYATITVIRTGGDAGSVSVNFTNTPGPHTTPGYNYVATNGLLTFAAGQIAASFNVSILSDGIKDPTNGFYFNVTLSNPTNATLGSPINAAVNIVDVDSYTFPPGSPDTLFSPGVGMNGDVLALALQSGGQILAGGSFTTVNHVTRMYVARLNTNGSLDTTFLAGSTSGANGPVNAIVNQTNDRILVGGNFTLFNDFPNNNLVRLMTTGSLDTSFDTGAGADGAVYALAETFMGGARKIYAGGAFGHIYNWSIASPGIARLNDDGTLDASFAPGLGADGIVYAIAVYPTNSIYAGKVLIGGAFTHYNGTNLNYIARLNADGSVDTTFNPGSAANGIVNAIAIQLDGRVLVGGSFFQFNGVPLNRIARLNADGSLDAGFTTAVGAGANNTVKGIALQADNRIVLVGQFTQVNGLPYNRIVRLLPTGALDTTIIFGDGANSDVDAAVIQPADGMIIIGGAFTQFNDQPYYHLVRLYGGSAGGSGTGGYGVVIPAGSALVSESFQPPNNIIDPGETVALLFAFRDIAGNNVSNLVATLLVTNGITLPSPVSNNYGSLIVGGPSVSRQFSFTASGTNGQTIAATFQLQNGTNNLGLGVFTYTIGMLTNTFANTNLIVINDHTSASPYPSTINVSGVGGSLIKVTVTFANLTHTWPADIDALLGSPYQQSALLMANAGGGNPVHGVTLTFDDAASIYPTNLPQAGQIISHTYLPTAYFPVAMFPAPAPVPPYATNLSTFIGSNPNGTWSLFVIDDSPGNVGAISNGWSLNVITASPIASQPLQFGSIVSSNGTFQFTITSPANSTIIQASTDLVNWVPVYTNYTHSFTYTDSNASSHPYRFYRAVSGP
jgi:uncharacterized delta-60 repeat protein